MVLQVGRAPDKNSINHIIRNAVIIRLIALAIIACSGSWEQSFIGQGVTDDWKYEMGAVLFEQNANNLFDVNTFAWAFNSVDSTDWTGYHLDKPITNSVLWYLIVCLLVWITKTKYSIRLLNIILVGFSMKYIYNFADKIWGEKVAVKASKLFAYLPYPVIFCCFGYKEELVLFCTFYLLSHSVDYRVGKKLRTADFAKMLLTALILLGIRSGISLILFAICLAMMFVSDPGSASEISIKKILPFFLLFVIGILAFIRFGSEITYKAGRYLGEGRGGGDTISVLMVNEIMDIWKLPLAYMYSIIMPISLFRTLDSWLCLIDNINICMVPISVGAFLYLMKKKPDKIVYWGSLAYYLIYVIASLNYFRQYSALLPINLIYYSAFTLKANTSEKHMLYFISAIMAVTLVVFYAM